MPSSGQLLAERYRLASRIAVGGMGEVWEANDTRLDRTVAVKILKAELSGDAEFLHRFRTEARTTASLNHPGIAGVHDYGETLQPDQDGDGSVPEGRSEGGNAQHVAYLVMELVRGEPLAGILAREGRLSIERTLDVLEQAGHALQAAHENGLVHRDVKPGNILVTAAGQVKITDFGVSKAADAAPVTRSGTVMGTAQYIAPEQALGHDAEPASDVYSLAVCGYECLAGYRPFRSENAVTVAMMHIRDMPPPLPADVLGGVRSLIEATLVKDPRRRYRNGGEFAGAVTTVRRGHPPPAPAATYAQPGQPGTTYAMTHTMAKPSQPDPGSHPAMRPVMPSGPIAPQQQPPQQPGGRSANTALWVTLGVLAVLVVVVAALVLPRVFDVSTTGTPDNEEPGPGGGFGVTDTSHPASDERSPLPSGRQSRLPSPTSTPGSSTDGPSAEEQSPTNTTERGTRAPSETATAAPSLPLGAAHPAADGSRDTDTGERHDRHGSGTVHHEKAGEAA